MPVAKEGNKKREPRNVTALYIIGKVIYTKEQ
jgi:hypothetical protein